MESRIAWALVIVLVLTLAVTLVPAIHYAQQERRDGIRRDEIITHKKSLEIYYNQHESYPLQYDAAPHRYIVEQRENGNATRWYLRAQLENEHRNENSFDEEHNVYYRFVNENDRVFYEVCGGTSTCDAVPVSS